MKASETTRHESEHREEATHPSESQNLRDVVITNGRDWGEGRGISYHAGEIGDTTITDLRPSVPTLEEFTKLLKRFVFCATWYGVDKRSSDAEQAVLAAYSRALGLIEVQTKVKEMGDVLIDAMADRLEKLES